MAHAALLAVAMFALQASIGALNDLVDLPADARSKPFKPLPRGLLQPADARAVVVLGLAVGLVFSWLAGPGATLVALLGVGIGYLYDLRLKGTALAWLPFALGIPLLPVYAWVGATQTIPSVFAVLIPAAVAAGAALALGNQVADIRADEIAGVRSAARTLGRHTAIAVMAALHAGVAAAALGSLVLFGGSGAGVAVVMVAIATVGVGVVAAARDGGDWLGARAWEIQASATGLLGAGWIAALADTGALAG